MSGRTSTAWSRDVALRRRRRGRLVGAALIATGVIVGIAVVAGAGDDRASQTQEEAHKPAAACGAAPPPPADPQQYERPRDVLEPGVDYGAVIKTSCGEITVDLLEGEAPQTVNSFVFLAREGYFDGLVWHRVVQRFVIQSGDPNGVNGQAPDGPGYTIPDEFGAIEGRDYTFGTVAMANVGQPDTGGSQFFIVVQPEGPAGLDPLYTIFGRARRSRDVLLEIAHKPTREGNDPATMDTPKIPIYIERVTITED